MRLFRLSAGANNKAGYAAAINLNGQPRESFFCTRQARPPTDFRPTSCGLPEQVYLPELTGAGLNVYVQNISDPSERVLLQPSHTLAVFT
jgi:hypothetical protein